MYLHMLTRWVLQWGALCITEDGHNYLATCTETYAFISMPHASERKRLTNPPTPLSQAGDNETGTLSQKAPVRSGQWTFTVTGASQGAIDKLSPKHLQPAIYYTGCHSGE